MDLNSLKDTWNALDNTPGQSAFIHPEKKTIMTFKIRNRLNKILLPEIAGTVVCIFAAGFLLFNFEKANTVFQQVFSVLTIIILLFLPVISFLSLKNLYKSFKTEGPYTDTLKEFSLQKLAFIRLQKINFLCASMLMVSTTILLPVFFKFHGNGQSNFFLVYALPIGYIFLLIFSRWVFKNYNNTINVAELLLKEVSE